MISAEAVVIDYLLNHPGGQPVRDVVGTRIYGSRMWPSEYEPSQGPALRLTVRGGTHSAPLLMPSVEYWGCGATPYEARRVLYALDDALQQGTTDRLRQSVVDVLVQEVPWPTPGWYLYWMAYNHWIDNI